MAAHIVVPKPFPENARLSGQDERMNMNRHRGHRDFEHSVSCDVRDAFVREAEGMANAISDAQREERWKPRKVLFGYAMIVVVPWALLYLLLS